MKSTNVNNSIGEDGLRYRSKAAGSPFGLMSSYSVSTMSCFLCSAHRSRPLLKARKLIGKTRYVCAPSCKDLQARLDGINPASRADQGAAR